MPLFEVVREIENQCERNQMRDVFFEEIETDDPLAAVRALLKDESDPKLTLVDHGGDSLTVFAESAGMTQRFLFTKI